MESKLDKAKAFASRHAKGIAMSAAGLGATVFGIAQTFAVDYDMSGPALNASAVTGFKAGVGDSVATIQTSLNNAYLTEIAIMFIGFAVIVGVVMHIVKGHRRI